MSRIAWFTPLPPQRSGISQYNRDLLPSLASVHAIDVFVSTEAERRAFTDTPLRVLDAHDFLWNNRQNAYDLTVYQLGNAPCHDYMWPYLIRYPGLVVLHDGQLHHARARALLQQQREDDYRREFWFNHPEARKDLAELGAAGLLGSLTYFWPMLRAVIEGSRAVVVHDEWLAQQIREAHPAAAVEVVEMGVAESHPRPHARRDVRSRHGIAEEAVVFAAFGRITPEKRIREALRAWASIADAVPQVCLLLVGETVDYYDLRSEARALGVEDKLMIAGYVEDDAIDDYLAATDICLCLRWPTSRETSASWLRCLAAGRPTISTDLVHTVEIPTLDPRNWSLLRAGGDALPVGVSIDLLDEDHSLRLAIRRLATDASLRKTLGSGAYALWGDRFRLERMINGYRRVIGDAPKSPQPRGAATLPEHLRSTGFEHARQVMHDAGLSVDVPALFTAKRD